MFRQGTKVKLVSLGLGIVAIRAVLCFLLLFEGLLFTYLGMLFLEGGKGAILAWVAHVSGSRIEPGLVRTTLTMVVLLVGTFFVFRLQAWLAWRTALSEIVEGLSAHVALALSRERVAANVAKELTQDLRSELTSNLRQMTQLRLGRAHWELASTTLRIFGRRSAPEHAAIIERVRSEWIWKLANTTVTAFAQRRAPQYTRVFEAARIEWLREFASDMPAYRSV